MKAHHRTDRLTIITILFVVIIGIVMLSYTAPRLNFEISENEMLLVLDAEDNILNIAEAKQALTNANTVFIDIRSKGEFIVKHVKDAVNIPMIKILTEESIDLFDDDSKTYILYGEDHLAANGPWMVLKQLGYNNVKVLLGGYKNFMNEGNEYPDFFSSYEEVEKPILDLGAVLAERAALIIKDDEALSGKSSKEPGKVGVKPKKRAAAPVVMPQVEEEEEEEEGC